ncbi:hypothetical protein [Actinoplanes regularis]|uniref:hypothetical protein n=1 Tax=Actinoplanes regularis TaxID=52697 RepID=UPI0025541F48|nr:hypothetical protein [Actinoplanes regularis]
MEIGQRGGREVAHAGDGHDMAERPLGEVFVDRCVVALGILFGDRGEALRVSAIAASRSMTAVSAQIGGG